MSGPRATRAAPWSSPWVWIAVGMAVRLVHVLGLGNRWYFGDTPEYESLALRLLHGANLGEATPRAPGYPLWLALSFAIGGEENYVAARLLQLGPALLQMWLAGRLATRIGGRAAGVFATSLVALTPTLVFASGLLYPTLVYSTLLLASTLVAWELAERPAAGRGILLGVLLVAAAMTDMVVLAPAAAIAAWLLARLPRAGGALGRGLVVSAGAMALLALPYLRLIRGQGGEDVFMGKAQAVLHFARTDPVISRPRWIRMAPGTRFEALDAGRFAAREWSLLRARPVAYAHDYVLELLHFFQPLPDRVTSQNRFNRLAVLLAGAAWFTGLLALALFGLVRGAGPPRGRVLVGAVVFATAAFYAFFFTQTRYRIPVEPHLAVLASLALPRAFPRLSALLAPERAAPEAGPSP